MVIPMGTLLAQPMAGRRTLERPAEPRYLFQDVLGLAGLSSLAAPTGASRTHLGGARPP